MDKKDVRTRSSDEPVAVTHSASAGVAAERSAEQAVIGCRSSTGALTADAPDPRTAVDIAHLSCGEGDLDSSSAQPELPPPTLTVAEASASAPVPPSASSGGGSSSGSSSGSRKRGRGRPPSCTPAVAAAAAESRVTTYHSPKDGTEYFVNDCVYLEANKQSEPYKIGRVKEFVVSKRDSLLVTVSLFYRQSEIPEQVYLRLLQDRSSELPNELADVIVNVRTRELFQSEKLDSYRASALRGKCTVVPYQDAYAARSFLPLPDTFFTTLHYNPDTRRLATIQGEIRIGASHQARLPECRPDVRPEDRGNDAGVSETLLWRPGKVCDEDLLMFLKTARSTAAFAGMCNRGGSASDGVKSACRDDTTQSAMDTLHAASYNKNAAITALVKSPLAQSVDRRWSDEDSKKFMKGFRIYGKNFFKIRKELLPHKETSHLVEYYYYWKKLPVAFGSRPNARRRPGFLRRQSARPATSEEQSSSSISDESEFDGTGEIVCFKCDVTIPPSKAWHQVDDRCYLCEDCSERYKKYGGRDETSDDSGGASAGSSTGALSDYMFKPLQPDASPGQPVECKVVVAAPPVPILPRVKNESTANLAGVAAADREMQPSGCGGAGTGDRTTGSGPAPTTSASSSSSFSTKASPPPKKRRSSPAGRTATAATPIASADGSAPTVSRSAAAATTGAVPSNVAGLQSPFVPPVGMAVPCLAPPAMVFSASDGRSIAAVGRAEGSESVIVAPTRSLLSVTGGGGGSSSGQTPQQLAASIADADADDAADSDDSEDVRLSSLIKVEPGSRSGSVTPPSFGSEPSPSPVVIEQKCHESQNAVFFRVIGRQKNSCSRSDIIFKPPPDHSFAKAREQRVRGLVGEVKVKEERRDAERPAERSRDHGYPDAFAVASSSSATSSRSYRPSSSSAAMAIPGSSSGGHCSSSAVADRSLSGTPRLFGDPTASPYYSLGISTAPSLGPCMTPALMHLGHLARPHGAAFGSDDYPRQLAAMQSFDAMLHHQAHSRLFGSGANGSGGAGSAGGSASGMFSLPPELRPSSVASGSALPHDVRERLEASWKSSQESMSGRELFEMHMRDKQNAAAAAAAGLNNPFLDPLFREHLQLQQLRMAAGGALPPGMAPPASLSAFVYQQVAASAAAAAAAAASSSGEPARDRLDRLSRLGYPAQAQTAPPSSESPLSVGDRVGFPPPPAHLSHTHTHTHVHVHQPPGELAAAAAAAAPFLPPHLLPGTMTPAAAAAAAAAATAGGPFIPPGIDPASLAALMGMGSPSSQAMGGSAATSGSIGLPSPYGLPPAAAAAALFGLPPFPPGGVGMGRGDNPLDFFGRQLDPLLSQQMQLPPHVQQELQRQAFDRERHFVAAMAAAAEASRH